MSQRTAKDTEIAAYSSSSNTIPSVRNVMVIGSSGFLGPYIVSSLLRKQDVSKILCVNRSKDGEDRTMATLKKLGYSDLADKKRLQFLVKDITTPGLGFSNPQFGNDATVVDAIVFNAWSPNWAMSLDKFSGLICGVQNVINFCVSSAKPPRVIFMSSVCAVGEWPREHPEQTVIPEEVSENSADALMHGYGKSKHKAERLLKRASNSLGLRVAIIRPGLIGGPNSPYTGGEKWPIQGWIYSIIKESIEKGYWPSHVQPVDWIPVDALADGIATTTICQWSGKHLSVYNMVHPEPAPWSLLLETLRDRYGLEIKEVGLPEWLALFEAQDLKLFNFIKVMGNGRESDFALETANASTMLPVISKITVDQLDMWLEGWGLHKWIFQSKL
ncbi:hypothetical protein HBH98_255270 [Parastagonospora nodorum]|nr:hypothetical protein HBH51_258140 [Parastagonospora nodorum]KAH4215267.1 hypothetical protein HBI06_258010 [Parastagonospora nodorum]KAH4221310.1 hypothetical protein HBI05_256170 [Parastagonospora nodorum]KAH4331558.1 hypothetical protein HBH98_255270 [Parastagonospora nodorum]KAH4354218.1 hypothetical protein HBH97_254180 [Parastagonospora nodorum]